jgi:hypothetical protein
MAAVVLVLVVLVRLSAGPAGFVRAGILRTTARSSTVYAQARDAWVSRLPTAEESDILNLAPGMPVLHVIHTARSADGDVREVSESVWPADRVMLIDEYEITSEAEQPNAQSEI